MTVLSGILKGYAFLGAPFKRNFVANVCGHNTKRGGILHRDGHARYLSLPLRENAQPDYCLACIQEMTIACAWCPRPVFIGDYVTLYWTRKKRTMPGSVVLQQKGEEVAVGCMACAGHFSDRVGFWIPGNQVGSLPSEDEKSDYPFVVAPTSQE